MLGSGGSAVRRLVLHIGTHKTGTTSFQAVLNDAAPVLLEHDVRVFASSVDAPHGGACELPLLAIRPDLMFPLRRLLPDSTLPSMQRAMRERVAEQMGASTTTVVASHEALSFARTEEEVEVLAHLAGGRQTSIVLVLREETSFLRSWTGQLQRMGYSTRSPYPDSLMNTSPGTWLTDWDTLINAYSRVFGRQSITVLRYEQAIAAAGSVLPPLWHAANLPRDLLPNDRWLNASPSEAKARA